MSVAFVAGATGYTGRAVVAELVARGIRTVAHVRPDSSKLAAWREQFGALGAEVDTTPWQPQALRETLERLAPDVVFGLLGTTGARAKQGDAGSDNPYEAIDYGLTALLIEAASALADEPRFVYLSSIGAGSGRGAYLRARQKIEARLQEGQLPFVVARPSFITGPDREEARAKERAAAAVTNGLAATLRVFGARRAGGRLRSMTGPELARALVVAALDPEAPGRILDAHDLRTYAKS